MFAVISHFYNEQLLIKEWIDWHKQFFDIGILINHQSTDNSVEIAKSVLPEGWKIVDTKLNDFNVTLTDEEVQNYEKELPVECWKMSLNTTEFIFEPEFKEIVTRMGKHYPQQALGFRGVCLVDKQEDLPISSPIWSNRTHGFLYQAGTPVFHRWRFIHQSECGHYTPGRHDTFLPKVNFADLYHLHLLYSPWPQCIGRKLQIQNRIPPEDKAQGFGIQHITNENKLNSSRCEALKHSYNLLEDPGFNLKYGRFLKCIK